ncbi:hypothetical protein ACOVAE_003060 [Listeria monocytogenes]
MEFANRMTQKEEFLTFIGDLDEWEQFEESRDQPTKKKGRPRERAMTNDEYKAIKGELPEINNQLIFGVMDYKVYSMLSNANHRTLNRPDYIAKDIKYHLGEYKKGMDNMRKFRPDLYEKCWDMITAYIENDFDEDLAPTIHRTKKDYEWKTIDILTAKDHKEQDNAKMQGAMIFKETPESYNLIGLELFSSKKELAKRLSVNENMIYTCKPGQVIKIDDIVIQFQDVIKGDPKPITKQEVLEKLSYYEKLIARYDKAGLIEDRDRIQKVYDIWKNTGESKGFLTKKEPITTGQ